MLRDPHRYRGNFLGYIRVPSGRCMVEGVVSAAPDPTLLERARAAASRGAWPEAYDLLVEGIRVGSWVRPTSRFSLTLPTPRAISM